MVDLGAARSWISSPDIELLVFGISNLNYHPPNPDSFCRFLLMTQVRLSGNGHFTLFRDTLLSLKNHREATKAEEEIWKREARREKRRKGRRE